MRLLGMRVLYDTFVRYGCPNNGKVAWNIGVICFYLLCIQICTGLLLTSYYVGQPDVAFTSIEVLLREVSGGWYIRILHSTGASFFFFFIYVHIARGFF